MKLAYYFIASFLAKSTPYTGTVREEMLDDVPSEGALHRGQ